MLKASRRRHSVAEQVQSLLGKLLKRARCLVRQFVRKHTLAMKVLKTVSGAVGFLVLCLDDPTTVTLCFRRGKYSGMERRDYILFILATIVSNLYWILGILAVGEGIRRIFFGP